MTIGDVLKNYRKKHNISQDKFVKKSGVSKGYISMLENNTNARDGKPIQPTIEMFRKLAFGMDMELDELLKIMDKNQEVSLTPNNLQKTKEDLDPLLQKIINCYNNMDEIGRNGLLDQAEYLLNKHPKSKTNQRVI